MYMLLILPLLGNNFGKIYVYTNDTWIFIKKRLHGDSWMYMLLILPMVGNNHGMFGVYKGSNWSRSWRTEIYQACCTWQIYVFCSLTQIEPNVVAENSFSLQCREFSANSKALVGVDCSMEECQDESSSKGVLLDVHYV